MADGDVVIDSEFELEAGGTRIELFACEDSSRPGGYRYRFQCYEPDDGTLLRYDNAHEHPTAGRHHRHTADGDEPEPITFDGLADHLDRFREEVTDIHANRR